MNREPGASRNLPIKAPHHKCTHKSRIPLLHFSSKIDVRAQIRLLLLDLSGQQEISCVIIFMWNEWILRLIFFSQDMSNYTFKIIIVWMLQIHYFGYNLYDIFIIFFILKHILCHNYKIATVVWLITLFNTFINQRF